MARSYRHAPIIGACSHTDKPGKVNANRAFRRRIRQHLHSASNLDDLVLPLLREVSDVWDFPKDGKCVMYGWEDKEGLRKLMRK